MAIYPLPVYTTSEVRQIAQRGQLLQIRDGAVVTDHGDGAATASEYGTAFTTALAALQSGDSLHMRGFEAAGKEWECTTQNVRIFAEEVTLLPQAPWDWAFRFNNADDSLLQGLIVDGQSVANSPNLGIAYWVTGSDRVQIINCRSQNIRGLQAQCAGIWWYTGADGVIKDYVSINDGWFGIAAAGNRITVDGFYCLNPGSRALNPHSVAAIDYQVYRRIQAVDLVNTTDAAIMFNGNNSHNIGDLFLEDFQFHHGDNASAGYSYNAPGQTPQLAKFQNTTRLHMRRGWWNHGRNDESGLTYSWRIDSPPNVGVDEIYVDECQMAGAISLTDNQTPVKYMRITNSHLGVRNNQSTRGLVGRFKCEDFLAEGTTFNGQNGDIFDIDVEHAATDWFRVINCRFLSNHASNRYVLLPASAESIAANIGRVVFHNNTLDNVGAGTMYRADNEFEELALTTDANGDLRFDDTLIGTGPGKHPDPGAGPSYFSGLTVPSTNGTRIFNINWSPDLTQVISEKSWIAHNGVWKELT